MQNPCRTCLSEEYNLTSIHSKNKGFPTNVLLSDMISLCTGIEVSRTDDLPQYICQTCNTAIKFAYEFRQKCWVANSFFLTSLGSQSTKEIMNCAIEEQAMLKEEYIELSNLDVDDNQISSVDNIYKNNFNKDHDYTLKIGCDSNVSNNILPFNGADASDKDFSDNSDTMNYHEIETLEYEDNITQIDGPENQICAEGSTDKINKIGNKRPDMDICFTQTTKKIRNLQRVIALENSSKDDSKNFVKTPIFILPKTVEQNHNLISSDEIFNEIVQVRTQPININPTESSNVVILPWPEKLISPNEISNQNLDNSDTKVNKRSCYLCDANFQNLTLLKKHVKIDHLVNLQNDKLNNQCKYCNRSYVSFSAVRTHLFRCHYKLLKCSECKLKFINSKQLNEHAQKLHNNNISNDAQDQNIKTRKCYICSEKFLTMANLKKHVMAEHKTKFEKDKMDNECVICNKSFNNYRSFRSHLQRHHPYKINCKFCDESLSNIRKLNEHIHYDHLDINVHPATSYNRKAFNRVKETDLIDCDADNLIENTSRKLRKCYICNKRFINIQVLEHHFKVKHHTRIEVDRLTNDCEFCNVNFSSYSLLKKHTDTTHFPKHICDYCGLTVQTKENLIEHVRGHTGEKPYQCEECDYKSAYRRGLQIHRLTHTGERAYECEICNKRFRTSSARAEHIQMNRHSWKEKKQFKCNCGKSFKDEEVFRKHFALHSIEKEIPCEICDQTFSTTQNLKRHLKIHTSKNNHICPHCMKEFLNIRTLNSHLRAKHKI